VAFSRSQGIEPDFSAKGIYDELSVRLVEHAAAQSARLDMLVIDESQDFEPHWVQALLPRLKETGTLYILSDSDQKVYPRDEFDLPDAVHVRCMDNFRSPRKIVQAINQFELTVEPVQARSVYLGQSPGFHTYVNGGKNSLEALDKCLRELLNDGISHKQIAVVTFAGRERSEVLNRTSLVGLSLKQFSGQYDRSGNAIWSNGDLLVETLYRFKGKSAPVVVLCEIDFEAFTDRERRKLFVGFSRAQFRLECVLSERAASLLANRIEIGQPAAMNRET
jgi:superfamily I DNA and RNA helicase